MIVVYEEIDSERDEVVCRALTTWKNARIMSAEAYIAAQSVGKEKYYINGTTTPFYYLLVCLYRWTHPHKKKSEVPDWIYNDIFDFEYVFEKIKRFLPFSRRNSDDTRYI